ncbi:endonuclease [Vibrio breoganii]
MRKLLLLFFVSPLALSNGNTTILSYSKANRLMQQEIFVGDHLQKTLYCGAAFNMNKEVYLPKGFTSTKYKNRLKKWEAEHITSAESFGRNFLEWREGHPTCVDSEGRSFKGRSCARKTNTQYRLMEADLYNLYPAIGAVNGLRRNYNFTMIPNSDSNFGSCDMRIQNQKAQPPERARGYISRAYLYMEQVYADYTMSSSQKQLMQAWDKQYPITSKECEIGNRIKSVQKSSNPIIETRCRELSR